MHKTRDGTNIKNTNASNNSRRNKKKGAKSAKVINKSKSLVNQYLLTKFKNKSNFSIQQESKISGYIDQDLLYEKDNIIEYAYKGSDNKDTLIKLEESINTIMKSYSEVSADSECVMFFDTYEDCGEIRQIELENIAKDKVLLNIAIGLINDCCVMYESEYYLMTLEEGIDDEYEYLTYTKHKIKKRDKDYYDSRADYLKDKVNLIKTNSFYEEYIREKRFDVKLLKDTYKNTHNSELKSILKDFFYIIDNNIQIHDFDLHNEDGALAVSYYTLFTFNNAFHCYIEEEVERASWNGWYGPSQMLKFMDNTYYENNIDNFSKINNVLEYLNNFS